MAIDSTTQPMRRRYFPEDDQENISLFSGIDSGISENNSDIGNLVNENLTGMLTGRSYDAARTQQRETLARAAKNLRTQSGAANAEALGQGTANRAQGQVEQNIFQGLADTEMGMNVEEQAMKERGISQAAAIGEAQQNVVTQRRGQDIGLQTAREQIASSERIATRAADLDEARLAETARQFNITSSQAADQFTRSLKFDYDQLSSADQQFLATLGFDRERFEESKLQFQATLEQENRLTLAELNIREKDLAENARQFDSRIDFDRWAVDQNITDAEKNRVWQAIQNDKDRLLNSDVAQMQNNTEVWKTQQTDILTRAGWDFEASQKFLDRQLTETMQAYDIALQREIENGRLSQNELQMVEQARQFNTQMEWEREAANLNIDADTVRMIWQTNERIGAQAFTATQSALDRQIQMEITNNQMDIQWYSAIQQASQFQDQLAWQMEAKNLDINEADATRIWQASENAKDRVFQANMQQLEHEFNARGWNYSALMNSIDSLPENQVADILRQTAIDAGIQYGATDADGKPVLDGDGNQVMIPGFKDYAAEARLGFDEAWGQYTPGQNSTFTTSQANSILSNISDLEKEGKAITDTAIESMDPVTWTTSGDNRWALRSDAKQWVNENLGKIYRASNGKLYEVVGYSNPISRNSKASISFRDVISNTIFSYTRGSEFPGG